jgi:hypothetical protein
MLPTLILSWDYQVLLQKHYEIEFICEIRTLPRTFLDLCEPLAIIKLSKVEIVAITLPNA